MLCLTAGGRRIQRDSVGFGGDGGPGALRQMIALILRGIAPLHHIVAIRSNGVAKELGSICIVPDKTCWRRKGQVHQVVKDKDLSIAVHPGSDADGWNRKLRRD